MNERTTTKNFLGQPGFDWLNPWRFAALLATLLFACFPQVVLGLEAFVYGDAGQFAYPFAFYHRESFWRGEIPFWNPYNSCGIPFMAQWNTLTLYPPALLYLLLPLPWSYGIFCLGHLFLAGLAMYSLAYRWTGNRLAAAVSGVAFAFNGLTWYGIMWPTTLAALAWMPFVVLVVERAWLEGKRYIHIAAIVSALQLLSGGAEVILQTWLLISVLWVVALVPRQSSRLRMTVRILSAGFAAAGLAAVQLLPFLDLLLHSQRNSAYSNIAMGGVAAMPFTGWINYLVPLFHCARNVNGVFVQVGQGWTGSYYLGISIIFLALLAVFRVRNYRAWILLSLSLFSLLMAMGSKAKLYDLVTLAFPLLGFMRFPVKFVALVTFTLPLLAAFGMRQLIGISSEKLHPVWCIAKWLTAALAVFIALFLFFGPPLISADGKVLLSNACIRFLFLAATLVCVALLCRQQKPTSVRVLQIALLALLWFDVFTHSSNLSPTVSSAALEPNTIRTFFKWDDLSDRMANGSASRFMESKVAIWKMLSTGTPNLQEDTNWRRLALYMNFNLLDHAPKFDGFNSTDLKEFLDVFKQVYFGSHEAAPLKDFLGISHVSDPTNLLNWVRRDSALPLITAGQKPFFAGPPATLEAILADSFDPLCTVYLPPQAKAATQSIGQSRVQIESAVFSGKHWRIQVNAEAPGMVVVAQTFFHAWHAYVDQRPTDLWRANYAFQALHVPAGQHRIDLIYEDSAFTWGAVISTLTLCSLVVSFVFIFLMDGLSLFGYRWPWKPHAAS